MPRTKYRWNDKNTASGITIEAIDPVAMKDAQVLQLLFRIILRGQKDYHVIVPARDTLGNPGDSEGSG